MVRKQTSEPEIEYEVERIIDKDVNDEGETFYLIKWAGYPINDSTWETESALTNYKSIPNKELQKMIEEYNKRHTSGSHQLSSESSKSSSNKSNSTKQSTPSKNRRKSIRVKKESSIKKEDEPDRDQLKETPKRSVSRTPQKRQIKQEPIDENDSSVANVKKTARRVATSNKKSTKKQTTSSKKNGSESIKKLKSPINGATSSTKKSARKTVESIKKPATSSKKLAASSKKRVKRKAEEVASDHANELSDAESAVSNASSRASSKIASLKKSARRASTRVKNVAQKAIEEAPDTEELNERVKSSTRKMSQKASESIKKASSRVRATFDDSTNQIRDYADNVDETVSKAARKSKNKTEELIDHVPEMEEAVSSIRSRVNNLIHSAKEFVDSAEKKAHSFINDQNEEGDPSHRARRVLNNAKQRVTELEENAKHLVDETENYVSQKASSLRNRATRGAYHIVNAVGDEFHSPENKLISSRSRSREVFEHSAEPARSKSRDVAQTAEQMLESMREQSKQTVERIEETIDKFKPRTRHASQEVRELVLGRKTGIRAEITSPAHGVHMKQLQAQRKKLHHLNIDENGNIREPRIKNVVHALELLFAAMPSIVLLGLTLSCNQGLILLSTDKKISDLAMIWSDKLFSPGLAYICKMIIWYISEHSFAYYVSVALYLLGALAVRSELRELVAAEGKRDDKWADRVTAQIVGVLHSLITFGSLLVLYTAHQFGSEHAIDAISFTLFCYCLQDLIINCPEHTHAKRWQFTILILITGWINLVPTSVQLNSTQYKQLQPPSGVKQELFYALTLITVGENFKCVAQLLGSLISIYHPLYVLSTITYVVSYLSGVAALAWFYSNDKRWDQLSSYGNENHIPNPLRPHDAAFGVLLIAVNVALTLWDHREWYDNEESKELEAEAVF